jgi:hypothetical protein
VLRQLCVQATIPMCVRTQTGRQAPDGDFDYPAEGVSVFLGTLYFGDHLSAGGTVEARTGSSSMLARSRAVGNHSRQAPEPHRAQQHD